MIIIIIIIIIVGYIIIILETLLATQCLSNLAHNIIICSIFIFQTFLEVIQ